MHFVAMSSSSNPRWPKWREAQEMHQRSSSARRNNNKAATTLVTPPSKKKKQKQEVTTMLPLVWNQKDGESSDGGQDQPVEVVGESPAAAGRCPAGGVRFDSSTRHQDTIMVQTTEREKRACVRQALANQCDERTKKRQRQVVVVVVRPVPLLREFKKKQAAAAKEEIV
jgi:hypothetical protein